MNTRRHAIFFSDGFRPALSARRTLSATRLLAALACCCLLALPREGLAANATPTDAPQAAQTMPAAPASTAPQQHTAAPAQEAQAPRLSATPFPAATPPAADAEGASGLDAQGRAAWRTLETGLLFGEFQLNDGDAKLTVVRIDPAYFDFTLCSRSQDGGPPRPLSQWGEQYDLVAAINASMYLPDRSTSTGYMRQGAHVNNGRVVQRFGAFFVAGPDSPALPSAAILDRDNPQWRQNLDHYTLVIQNYRMINADRRILWSPGGPHYSISAVAQDGDGQILFMHCRQPVEAYAFAQQVLHLPLNVRTVMYVEGGGQAGLLVRSAALTQELVGLNPGGFLVTGDLRAMLPNILGARRKKAPAGETTASPAPAEQPAAAPEAPLSAAQPQNAPAEGQQPEAQARPTDENENVSSAPAPKQEQEQQVRPDQDQPDVTRPEVVRPDAAPAGAAPTNTTPTDAATTDAVQNKTSQSPLAVPDASQSGMSTSGAAEPSPPPVRTAPPGTAQPGASQSEAAPAGPPPSTAAPMPVTDTPPSAPSLEEHPSAPAPAEPVAPLTEPGTSLVSPPHAPSGNSPQGPDALGGGAANNAR